MRGRMNADPRLVLGGGGFLQKVSNQVPLIVSPILVLENAWKLRRVSRSSPLHFALHYPLSLIRLTTGPPQLWSPHGPQVPLLRSWQPQTPETPGEGRSQDAQAGLHLGQIGPPAEAARAWTRSPVPQAGRRTDSSPT